MNIYSKHLKSTRLFFYVGGPTNKKILEVHRDNSHYYRVENEKLVHIGNLQETVTFLANLNAELAIKQKGRYKTRSMFFDRGTAISLLKKGFCVVLVEMKCVTLSYDDEYTHIISSEGKSFEEGSLPAGSYCLAFNEKQLPKTYYEVKAEKLFAKATEEQDQKELEAKKEAARKLFERVEKKKKIEERNRREAAKNQLKRNRREDSTAENESFLKFLGAAAIFTGGVGFGLLLKH